MCADPESSLLLAYSLISASPCHWSWLSKGDQFLPCSSKLREHFFTSWPLPPQMMTPWLGFPDTPDSSSIESLHSTFLAVVIFYSCFCLYDHSDPALRILVFFLCTLPGDSPMFMGRTSRHMEAAQFPCLSSTLFYVPPHRCYRSHSGAYKPVCSKGNKSLYKVIFAFSA